MKNEKFFKRYELKYLLDGKTYKKLLKYMEQYTQPDEYAESDICNLYLDTDDYRLVRRSNEKPVYKEKMRLRSYCIPKADTPVFLEIKKKFESVVYKRRMIMTESEALEYINGGAEKDFSQIAREIDYFKHFYGSLEPKMYIAYKRHSFVGVSEPSFRITFDEDIVWRDYDLALEKGKYGRPLLEEGQVLMEVKAQSAIPLWFTKFLTENHIYRTSFSKYGKAYTTMLLDNEGGMRYA